MITNARDRGPVRRFQKVSNAAARFQCDIALPFDRAPYHEFNKWPRHAQIIKAKIALWKRIKAWNFEQRLGTDPYPNSTLALEFCFEIREEFDKRVETTSEENMNLPRLGCAGAHDRRGRQGITIEHGDVAEIGRQGLRRCEAANARSDHDRVSPE